MWAGTDDATATAAVECKQSHSTGLAAGGGGPVCPRGARQGAECVGAPVLLLLRQGVPLCLAVRLADLVPYAQ